MTVRWLLAILVAGSLSNRQAAAQDIDSAGFERKGAPSLGDSAESEPERRAFAALVGAKEPERKKSLALDFASRFPSSWLLAGVWQTAAAACVDLNDAAGVIEYGRRSLELRPENPILLIAIARAEVMRGETRAKSDARAALLWLSVLTGPVGMPAGEWDRTRRGLEEYARHIAMPDAMPDKRQPLPPVPNRKEGFGGSASCQPCHKPIYDSWLQTGMAKMLRSRADARLLSDFSRTREFRNSSGDVEARIGGSAQPFFEFRTPDRSWKRYSVDFVIGSKWQQAYATSLPDGRFFVFPFQYNALTGEWLNYWQTIDPPGSVRADVGHFPDLSEATSYQRNCAVCHTSQLRLTRPGDTTMERATFSEPGIDCETCHGPSARHGEQMRSGKKMQRAPAEPPFRFKSLEHVEATLICGQCHRQSAVRNLGAAGEMNFTTESPFFARLQGQSVSELNPRAVYKDGRFRETTFIGEAFMRSACFLRGTAQCASCHDPHPADVQSNPVSLRFLRDPDKMCLQCHPSFAGHISRHTRHPEESAGSRCAACHMPPIMNALSFRAASHQISDIPRANLVARFGAEQSPNACLLCHRDRDVQWLAARLAEYRPQARTLGENP